MRHGGAFRLTGLILGIVIVFSIVGLLLSKRPVMPRVRADKR